MSAAPSSVAAGLLLLVAGVWLLLQTLVGDLPARLVGLTGNGFGNSASSGSPAAAGAGQVGGQAPTFDSSGNANPGTGVAPGAGTGPGGAGYGTGNAPGWSSDPNKPGGALKQT